MKKLIFIFLLFILSCTSENIEKNEYIIKEENLVVNTTKYDITTISHFTLNILNIKNTTISIAKMPSWMINQGPDNSKINGLVIENGLNNFTILLNGDLSLYEGIRTILHEIVHIKQVYNGRLVVCDLKFVEFNGKSYEIMKYPYNLRPWESEAYYYENIIYKYSNYFIIK